VARVRGARRRRPRRHHPRTRQPRYTALQALREALTGLVARGEADVAGQAF
jgi:hypothetical protein